MNKKNLISTNIIFILTGVISLILGVYNLISFEAIIGSFRYAMGLNNISIDSATAENIEKYELLLIIENVALLGALVTFVIIYFNYRKLKFNSQLITLKQDHLERVDKKERIVFENLDAYSSVTNLFNYAAEKLEWSSAILYNINAHGVAEFAFSYALPEKPILNIDIEKENGFLKQVTSTKKKFSCKGVDFQDDKLDIKSSLGEISPTMVTYYPVIKNNKVVAVIEAGMFGDQEIERQEETDKFLIKLGEIIK